MATATSTARAPAVEAGGASEAPPAATRAEWLADVLRKRILAGVYAPGERIRESSLQQEFGFSNGPTREALQLVASWGLAERAPWRGVRVVELSETRILELFQVRTALLEYAAELAARNATEQTAEDAARLKKSLGRAFSEVDGGADHPSFSGRLSAWLLAAAGNATLQQLWTTNLQQTLIYVNASIRKSAGARSRAHINALIEAIVAGDVAQARKSARDLTRQTLADLNLKGTV